MAKKTFPAKKNTKEAAKPAPKPAKAKSKKK